MTNHLYTLKSNCHIENYQIIRVLGVGGFGITYQAHDLKLNVSVAIKEYFPHNLAVRQEDGKQVQAKSAKDKSIFDYGLQRFLDEARTLAMFKHQSIVRVSRYLEKHGTAYIIMDYEEGVPLSRYLMRCKTLNEAEIKNVFRPILRGLILVHDKEYLHRDVKPSNIYLRKKGAPVLLDFGAARQSINQQNADITNLGTQGYAPIEQFSKTEPQGPWTDIYGVGATIYHCLTGMPPIPALDRVSALHAGRNDPMIPAVKLKKSSSSKALLKCIDLMLSVQGQDRPKDINEIIAEFSVKKNIEQNTILTDNDVDWDAELVAQAERHLTRYLGPLAQTIVKQSMSKSTNIEDLYRTLGSHIDSYSERSLFLQTLQSSSSLTAKVERRQAKPAPRIKESVAKIANASKSGIDTETEQRLEKHLAIQIGPLANMLVRQAMQDSPDLVSVVDILCDELPTAKQKESFRKLFAI